MYELAKNRTVPKCPACGLLEMTQKTWSRICRFTGMCHCTWVKGGWNAPLPAIFRAEYLIQQTYQIT